MAVDDQARLSLLHKLTEILGPEDASTLMSLPPGNWPELATKADLAEFRSATTADLAELKEELRMELQLRLESTENRILTHVHREMTIQTRIYVLAIVTTLVALSSVTVLTS